LNLGYEQIIKILEKCAEEEGIPKKLVKEIYDLERSKTHLTSRGIETTLREKVYAHLENEK
jgi:hypothetical protein